MSKMSSPVDKSTEENTKNFYIQAAIGLFGFIVITGLVYSFMSKVASSQPLSSKDSKSSEEFEEDRRGRRRHQSRNVPGRKPKQATDSRRATSTEKKSPRKPRKKIDPIKSQAPSKMNSKTQKSAVKSVTSQAGAAPKPLEDQAMKPEVVAGESAPTAPGANNQPDLQSKQLLVSATASKTSKFKLIMIAIAGGILASLLVVAAEAAYEHYFIKDNDVPAPDERTHSVIKDSIEDIRQENITIP